MAVALTKNFLPLCLLYVLEEHAEDGAETDDEGNRYLTQQQIREFVQADLDMNPSYRTIERNMRSLLDVGAAYPELGCQLSFIATTRRGAEKGSDQEELVVYKGWRLERDSGFETSEVRMLIDAAAASPMIPPRQVDRLIRRLATLAPEPIALPNITREGHLPAVNKQFFLNMELLNEAIQQKRYVSFVLGAFDTNGTVRREGPDGSISEYRSVVPLQMLESKGHLYFVAQSDHGPEPIKFRVDLMLDIRIEDEKVPADAQVKDINVARFREQHSYMMSGEVRPVKLRVDRGKLHAVYDQFGPNVHFSHETDETVDVSLESAKYSVLFWALQYYRYVEVLEPQAWRDELANAGQCITRMYEGAQGAVPIADRQYPSEG